LKSSDRHCFSAACLVAVLVAMASDARADDTAKKACVGAHIEGQRLRDAGKLKAARQEFLACAVESCPALLRKDCLQWLEETDAAMPTLLIRAQSDGRDTADVSVLVDGESAVARLTGMPFSVDPGEHVLRFVAPDGRTKEARVVLNAGEKNRRVTVDLSGGAPAPSEPPEPKRVTSKTPAPTPTAVYVLGGVGIVAMGSFAFFGLKAFTQGNDLKASCAPACSDADSSAVHRNALIADVSLGVGIVALGAATWILLTHREPASALLVTPSPPAQHGGAVGWQTRF
jgi:hypothetical protein